MAEPALVLLPGGAACTIVLDPEEDATIVRHHIAQALHCQPIELSPFSLIVHRRDHEPVVWPMRHRLTLHDLSAPPTQRCRRRWCVRRATPARPAFGLELRSLVAPAYSARSWNGSAHDVFATSLLYAQSRDELARGNLRLPAPTIVELCSLGVQLSTGEHDPAVHGA